MTRTLLTVLWLTTSVAPLLWWLRRRRDVDVWKALPVAAAIVSADGTVLGTSGPAPEQPLRLTDPVPARGVVTRGETPDGRQVAVGGVGGGRALLLAVDTDPLRQRRDQLLSDLGSRLAHDLNTPMAAVLGHLDLVEHQLGASSPDLDAARASLAVCTREITRAQQLASDLLTLTRLRAGTARRAPVAVAALAEEAVAGLLPLADSLGADLRVDAPTGRVLVDAADADLVRALRNLLSNALLHARPAATERLRVRLIIDLEPSDDTVVRVSVVQSGPGLTAAQLDELREPLTRGSHERSGTGLGLAIVDEVLRAHGAALSVTTSNGLAGLGFALPRYQP